MPGEKIVNWRKLNINRDRRFEGLIESLNSLDTPIFTYIKDIMVFAAMVGYSENSRRSITKSGSIPILLETYATDQKDSFIYLLALMESKDATLLKDENLSNALVIFEEFCNGGLYIIESWIEAKPADSPIDIILSNIYDKLIESESSDFAIDNSALKLPDI